MGADRISQLKQPPLVVHRGAAKKDVGLNTNILNIFCTDNLFDVDPEQLVLFILQTKPKRPDLSRSTAHGYHVHGKYFLLHVLTAFLIIIARLFAYSKQNFLVASFPPV